MLRIVQCFALLRCRKVSDWLERRGNLNNERRRLGALCHRKTNECLTTQQHNPSPATAKEGRNLQTEVRVGENLGSTKEKNCNVAGKKARRRKRNAQEISAFSKLALAEEQKQNKVGEEQRD